MTPTPKSRAAESAPSISASGAWSLPIASRTTFPVERASFFDLVLTKFNLLRFVLPEPPRGLCSIRTSGKRDVACGAHGNLDRVWSGGPAEHRAHDACRGE